MQKHRFTFRPQILAATILTLAFTAATPASTSVQTLSDAHVAAAIKAGEARKLDPLVSECYATSGFGSNLAGSIAGGVQPTGGFHVTVSGAEGRIAFLARNAKRLYKPFTIADVTDDMRQAALLVQIEPGEPSSTGNTIRVASPIEHVVLKSKTKDEATAQPTRVEKEPVEWTNLLGGKVEGSRALAVFDVAVVKELPPGDFDVVVITAAGERRCKVGAKDRTKVLAAK